MLIYRLQMALESLGRRVSPALREQERLRVEAEERGHARKMVVPCAQRTRATTRPERGSLEPQIASPGAKREHVVLAETLPVVDHEHTLDHGYDLGGRR